LRMVSREGLVMNAPPNVLDRPSEALDQVERSALAFIEHPCFVLRDLAQIVELGEQAGNGDSRRSDEETKRLVFVVARLFRDAPVSHAHLLKAGKFVDRSQMVDIGFSVRIDQRKDRIDRGRGRQHGGGIVAATAAPAAVVSKCRRAWSTGGLIFDAVIRGVLSTLSAWVILDLLRCGLG
jgi:hypothetical protein